MFKIQDDEECPDCGTDISVPGNGCNLEIVKNGKLKKLKRRCLNCRNEWEVKNRQ